MESWKIILSKGTLARRLAPLKHSRKNSGWRALGLPPCIGKKIGPVSSTGLDPFSRWDALLTEAFRKQTGTESVDPRLVEYRKLYRAYQRLQTGKLRGKVSERTLYLDLKSLEEQLLPEHLDKARKQVKSRLLGSEEFETAHPQSRVRSLLGALTTLPPNARERYLFQELSQVAVSEPRELGRYASYILDEIRRCPEDFSQRLLPTFERALAQVGRVHAERVNGGLSNRAGDFRNLLLALTGQELARETSADSGELEFYRSGLTVNGTVRDYTYV
jgi:hypothetical protein